MKHRPFTNQPERRLRLNVARDHLTAEVELPVLPLMLGVEMRGLVLLVYMRTTIPKKIEMMGTAAVYRRRIGLVPGSFRGAICLVFGSIRILTVQRSNACGSPAAVHDRMRPSGAAAVRRQRDRSH